MCTCTPTLGHKQPRYKFPTVCRIFGVHEDTLRDWMKRGVPLRDGTRMRIAFLPLGLRKIEFEVAEVERVYQALRGSSLTDDYADLRDGDVVPFPATERAA